jgi:hypothetical protein
MGLHPAKKLLNSKGNSYKLKRKLTEWEKMFASSPSEKGLKTITKEECKKLTPQRINNPMNKWTNELNRKFSKEIQMANKCTKKCLIFLAIKEM